ncbi:MAG: right-handed parallel beta-helix repeat-containing protein [Candidatus Celaenobacter antarcticus]|nr:right-handed parallel beta-helix repeat-containing protein [Candidatus Celaenobacter antarcticus]
MEKFFYTNKLVKGIIFLFINIIFLNSHSFADTHIHGGNVIGIWSIDGSPYIIDGEIYIPVDNTLRIEPGVQIIFSGHHKFKIYGRLLAVGTASDTITFTVDDTTGFSNPDTTAGGWHGLRFIDTEVSAQDSSKIVYCKLEYGKASGNYPDNHGGAIYCINSSDILMKNCLIRNNRADDYGTGGGICCNESSPIMCNVFINRNYAEKRGGGIYCYQSSPILSNVTVSENTVALYDGGGIHLEESYPYLGNVTISRNYAARNGGGIYCDYSNPILQDVIINENSTDSTYLNAGGGIYFYHSSPFLDSVIINNNKTYYGGGICCQTSSPILANVTIYGNTANGGGGIYCNDTSRPNLSNVTISENTANHGGGIGCCNNSSPVLLNCILWNNATEEFYLIYGSTVTVTYSDITDGWTGEGNIDEDPLFEDPTYGDFHLTEYSPCIDAGNPASVPDPDGTIIDMGSYYFHQSDVIPPTADFCADVTAGNAPLTVHFTDTSYPGNSDIASWYWNFGDSTFSEEQNPVHIYDNLGIYTVSLRVITENNGIDTETKIDYINAYGSGFHIPGGDVSGVWITNFSPYIIDGDINIQQGDSLRIEPGVQILFSGHYQCDIYGTLRATGTEDDSILFTAQDTITGWNGLKFDNTNSNRQDSSKIVHCECEYGNSDDYGGAISFINSSNVLVKNTVLTKNSAAVYGGGIYCEDSNPLLRGVNICNNVAHRGGGGIYLVNSYPVFDPENRCSLFLNYAGIGNDLHANDCSDIDIILDTFTVASPDDHFASPINNFTFDILNGKIEPVEQDLYVSPYGSNNNSGLTSGDPLRTLSYALVKIAPNIIEPYTIHCTNGTYSSSMNEEAFPLNCKSYVSISGEDEALTILDGEGKYGVIYCQYDTVVTLENMTIKNGKSSIGSGIDCYSSILDLANMTITENGISPDENDVFHDKKKNLKGNNNFIQSYSQIDDMKEESGFIPAHDRNNDYLSLQEISDKESRISMAGGIYCGLSTLKITDATISYNSAEEGYGGALFCERSNTTLSNVNIHDNSASYGGGICSSYSSLSILDATISLNSGSGIYSSRSNITLHDAIIRLNSGGGICSIEDSLLSITNASFDNNNASYGGAIRCKESIVNLCNINMHENYAGNGGAIYIYACSPTLSDVTISNNHGKYCGGIACDNGTVLFNDENLCSIFLNYGGKVNDLYFNGNCPVTDVIVDTFTVLQPNDYFVYPLDLFTFDINCGKIEPVDHDLYVDPDGSDNNSGLTTNDPLQTIAYALIKIHASESTPHTIHCADGLYSSSETGEKFPLNCKSYVSMIGEDKDVTVLDGEDARAPLFCLSDSNVVVTDMTIMNGNNMFGGGIYCSHSTMDIDRVIFRNNYADALGGGVLCWDSDVDIRDVTCDDNICQYGRGGGIACDDYSNVSVINGLICNNTSKYGGGLSCYEDSRMVCKNLTIESNTTTGEGGGVYCSNDSRLICSDLTIANNTSTSGGGGIDCSFNSISELKDVVISGNVGYHGGGIECFMDSYIDLKNVLIYRNRSDQFSNGIYCAFASANLVNVTISKNNYSNVDAGGIFLRQADANVVNCILWNDGHDILLGDTVSIATVIYSDIEGGWTGEGNINTDPLFINPNEDNFQLSSNSPCINAGIPDTTGLHIPNVDLNGDPRIYDDIIDMGCYEWQGVDVEPEPAEPNQVTITCFPNPFSTSVTISFNITTRLLSDTPRQAENPEIKIYNIKGQLIKTITSFPNPRLGTHKAVWDGKDESGKDVKSGVYFYKLDTKSDTFINKLIKLK